MFGFVFQISSLVTEKELKLRQVIAFTVLHCQNTVSLIWIFDSPSCYFPWPIVLRTRICELLQAMSIMGLYESAFWLSWLMWEALLTLLSALFTVLFGMMFQFDFFLHNSFPILFLVFFLFQLNMVSFCFKFAMPLFSWWGVLMWANTLLKEESYAYVFCSLVLPSWFQLLSASRHQQLHLGFQYL